LRYRLRTLLILLAVGPPILAGAWVMWREWQASDDLEEWCYSLTETHPLIIWDDEPPIEGD
jgi:hypothetical protein